MDENKTGVFPAEKGKGFDAYYNNEHLGKFYLERQAEIAIEKKQGTYIDGRGRKGNTQVTVNIEYVNAFDINERFLFLEKAVSMSAKAVQPSIIVSGRGGLGKTYTVRKTLKTCGLDDYTSVEVDKDQKIVRDSSFVFIKGFSTPKSLYRTLYEKNGGVVVFDDCDSILNNPTALNILKAALDSYDVRKISWGSELRDDDLPQSFEFTGQIIFITNMDTERIDQAILSRSLVIDVSMNLAETIERMTEIVSSREFLPEYNDDIKLDALEFIDKHKERAKELSLRTLITICKIRANNDDWERMSEYVLVGGK
jgi:hypothetical protein